MLHFPSNTVCKRIFFLHASSLISHSFLYWKWNEYCKFVPFSMKIEEMVYFCINPMLIFTVFPLLAHTYSMSASSRLLDVGQSLLHMHFGTRVLFFSGIRSTWHSLGESHLNSLQGLQCPLETTARSSIRFSHAIRFKWHSDGYSRPFEPVFIIWV